MNEYAWLEFYRGKWHLFTGRVKGPVRAWTNKSAAFSELTQEGWKISGPYLTEESRLNSMAMRSRGRFNSPLSLTAAMSSIAVTERGCRVVTFAHGSQSPIGLCPRT